MHELAACLFYDTTDYGIEGVESIIVRLINRFLFSRLEVKEIQLEHNYNFVIY